MNKRLAGFTLIELLTVVMIIAILAGLTLATVGYIQKKAARSRAETEIASMGAALESYRLDEGAFPRDQYSDKLDARVDRDPRSSVYQLASRFLYEELSGDRNRDRLLTTNNSRNEAQDGTQYFEFPPSMLIPSGGEGIVLYIADPFGYSYGYSTAALAKSEAGNQGGTGTGGNKGNAFVGYNPDFDLWSTSGQTAAMPSQWITNWPVDPDEEEEESGQ